jgi:hypothetical protein
MLSPTSMFNSPLHKASVPVRARWPALPIERKNVRATGRACRAGAVLVEVVLALALFVAAAAVISGGMSASMDSVERLRLNAHASDLAVTVVSELQMGTLAADGTGPQEFDLPFEDWTWEVLQAPVDDGAAEETRLTHVEVIIRHRASSLVHRLNCVLRLSPPKNSQSSGTAGGTL